MVKTTVTVLFAAMFVADLASGAEMEIVKVHALANGSVVLDGRRTTVDELRKALVDAHGHVAVWYYREHADQEPTDGQMKIVKVIIETKTPVSLSTKPDFSDVVGQDGQSHPRTGPN